MDIDTQHITQQIKTKQNYPIHIISNNKKGEINIHDHRESEITIKCMSQLRIRG
jgi:hypothetical protein